MYTYGCTFTYVFTVCSCPWHTVYMCKSVCIYIYIYIYISYTYAYHTFIRARTHACTHASMHAHPPARPHSRTQALTRHAGACAGRACSLAHAYTLCGWSFAQQPSLREQFAVPAVCNVLTHAYALQMCARDSSDQPSLREQFVIACSLWCKPRSNTV